MKNFVLFTIGFLCGCAIGLQEVIRLGNKLYTFFVGMVG